jgi:hypothetical protein
MSQQRALTIDELFVSMTLEIGALIALLDRKGLLNKAEVLAEIKSLQQQLAQRLGELPDQQPPCPEPYLNVQVENALVDRILELFNATKLTSHQARRLRCAFIASSSWVGSKGLDRIFPTPSA